MNRRSLLQSVLAAPLAGLLRTRSTEEFPSANSSPEQFPERIAHRGDVQRWTFWRNGNGVKPPIFPEYIPGEYRDHYSFWLVKADSKDCASLPDQAIFLNIYPIEILEMTKSSIAPKCQNIPEMKRLMMFKARLALRMADLGKMVTDF